MIDQIVVMGESFLFALVAVILMWFTKLYRDWRTPFDDNNEVVENSNAAVGLRRAGLFLGSAIGISGAIVTETSSDPLLTQIGLFALDAVVVIVLLLVARFINDTIILSKIKNDEAVKNGNIAVGFVEFGSYLATGLILFGVFSGEGGGYEVAVGFFALGQVALFLLIKVYQVITPFDVYEEINKGNAAAGLAVGGMLTALGIILQATVTGAFTGWAETLADFGIYTVFGIILLVIFRWIIDLLFLPKTKLAVEIQRNQNIAAIAVAQGALIGVAVIISNMI
ncbi:DUF350 domain-containing protein [candidate division KSB1 bacterium]|nr:DUF350 domain-containing protein [candidate division KSB1 bacterium]